MRQLLVALMALGILAGSAVAAPPTAEQKAEFYKVCLRNSGGNTALCDCKAEEAPKLIDADFMAIVISSMRGAALDPQYAVAYDTYVARSNAVCIPGY